MAPTVGIDPKADLHRYLRQSREALVWKLDGLSDYDVRRPLVPSSTNLLGLVKHVAGVAAGYFGETFGRPFPESLPWLDEDAEPDADLWATGSETRDSILALHQRAWAHADATIEALSLDTPGRVPWWPVEVPVTLHRVMVHMVAETARHAGHADLVAELIDGRLGHRADSTNLPDVDAAWCQRHHARVEAAAKAATA